MQSSRYRRARELAVLPPVAQQLLRSMESTTDRAKVEELLGAIYTESKP
jgi:hypothetical protein